MAPIATERAAHRSRLWENRTKQSGQRKNSPRLWKCQWYFFSRQLPKTLTSAGSKFVWRIRVILRLMGVQVEAQGPTEAVVCSRKFPSVAEFVGSTPALLPPTSHPVSLNRLEWEKKTNAFWRTKCVQGLTVIVWWVFESRARVLDVLKIGQHFCSAPSKRQSSSAQQRHSTQHAEYFKRQGMDG